MTSVYGYWIFLLGFMLGVVGIGALLVEFSSGGAPDYVLREGAFILAAISLPFSLLGIVLMLPVRARGTQVAVLGLAVAAAGIGWFSLVYPAGWAPNALVTQVIAVYGVGVIVVAGVAALIPVVTGERSALAESTTEVEPTDDQSPVVLGDALRGAVFAVFDTGSDWTWRLIEEEAIADTADEYLTRLETEERVEDIKGQIAAAGMLEIKGAAFRLYDTAADTWRWMLVREDGGVVADGGDDFETRNAAEESVNRFKEYAPEAEPLSVDGAAFDYVRDGNRWRWVLLDDARNEVAQSAEAYRHHHGAATTVELVKGAVPDAGVLAIDRYGIELLQEDGEDDGSESWSWRMITAADTEVAHSAGTFASRSEVESAAVDLLEDLEEAVLIEANEPLYEVAQTATDSWNWRLVGAGNDRLANGHADASDAATVERGAQTMKAQAAGATVFEIEGTSFEVYPDGDAWRWRLVTDDREVIAIGDSTYPERAHAQDAVDRVRAQAPEAELIEFETAAFQIYEVSGRRLVADGGAPDQMEWRWRLIDEGGDVLADSGDDYGTRDQALSSMTVLKKYAPDAELLEIDTAAFELHENDDGQWVWRLIDEMGTLIARSGRAYPSRAAAREGMTRVVDSAAETASRTMETAGFQVYHDADDDRWHWRFLQTDGEIVADGASTFATRDQATAAIEDLRAEAVRAPIRVLDTLAIVLAESDGTWYWEVVDTDREPIAEGSRTYADRGSLDGELNAVQAQAQHCIVFDIEDYVFRLHQQEGDDEQEAGWTWELIDEDRTAITKSVRTYDTEREARDAIDRIRRIAPDAGSIDYDVAAFEVTETAEGWRWRLIDEDDVTIAAGTEVHETEAAAIDELEDVKAVVADASILEIDTAAFELYENDDGWRWRLVDDDGDLVGRSIEAYAERSAAREEMRTVKELGPSARTAVAEYA